MTADPIETVLRALPDARRSGRGWSARCPAHEDLHASLSIAEGEDGRVLLACHAGCAVDAITDAIGLRVAELFSTGDAQTETAAYDYQDAEGRLLFQVVRFSPKTFRQRRPDGVG